MPVKNLLALRGQMTSKVRLPLVEISAVNENALHSTYKNTQETL